ncbi:DUF3618 domain-containing protein [Actinoplanes sp. NPDC051859]|uniref:DUF3618 domain-containing protein n=1 Tax=Actinoplanes sp. NPDC051859 TaxID=3363909 RepID=UPI0037BBAEB7
MKINHTDRMSSSHTVPGAPENVRAEIENSRANLGGTVTALHGATEPRTRFSGALSTVKAKTASGVSRVRDEAPQRARQARQAVQERPLPAAATALSAAGAVAVLLVARRRAKARAARNRWLGFLHR